MFVSGVLTGMGLLMAVHGVMFAKPTVALMGVAAAVLAATTVKREGRA